MGTYITCMYTICMYVCMRMYIYISWGERKANFRSRKLYVELDSCFMHNYFCNDKYQYGNGNIIMGTWLGTTKYNNGIHHGKKVGN